jgi:hypothetical protein
MCDSRREVSARTAPRNALREDRGRATISGDRGLRDEETVSIRLDLSYPRSSAYSMERIWISWSATKTTSPSALPIRARATGET